MAGYMPKMFQDGARADQMGHLLGMRGNLQDLAEGAERIAGDLGGCIRARIGDHDDPQRGMPPRKAVGCENAQDAFSDRLRLIARRHDDTHRFNFSARPRYLAAGGGGDRSWILSHVARVANPT